MKKIIILFLILCNFNIILGKEEILLSSGINISKKELDENNIQIQKKIKEEIETLPKAIRKTLLEELIIYGAKQEEIEFFSKVVVDNFLKFNLKSINYKTKDRALVILEIEIVSGDVFESEEFIKKLGYTTKIQDIDLTDKKNQGRFKKVIMEEISKSKKETVLQEIKVVRKNGKWELEENLFDLNEILN